MNIKLKIETDMLIYIILVKMPDYKNGKIYKIVCNETDEIYIGSTALSLEDRLSSHQKDGKREKRDGLCCSKQIIDRGNYYIELLQNYPCNSRCELEQKEGEYQRANTCINIQILGRTQKEWEQDNKEKISKYNKEYNQKNLETIVNNRKEYYQYNKEKLNKNAIIYRQNNKETIAKYKKEYRQNNLEAIKARTCKVVICECGIKSTHEHLKRHKTSKKHIDLMNKLNLS